MYLASDQAVTRRGSKRLEAQIKRRSGWNNWHNNDSMTDSSLTAASVIRGDHHTD